MRSPIVASVVLLAALLPACGDDTATGVSATDSGGETSTSTTGEPMETTGMEGICVENSQCEDGNECTYNRCAGDGQCLVEAVLSNACRPQISVDYPPRGATIVGEPGVPVVTVKGKAESAASTRHCPSPAQRL